MSAPILARTLTRTVVLGLAVGATLAALWAVTLAGAHHGAAGPDAAGYVLYARAGYSGAGDSQAFEQNCNGSSNDSQGMVSGSGNTFWGRIHSGADLSLTGDNNLYEQTSASDPEITYGSNDSDCDLDEDPDNNYQAGSPAVAAPADTAGGWPGNLNSFLSDGLTFGQSASGLETSPAWATCDVGNLTLSSDYNVTAADEGKVICRGAGKIVFSLTGQGSVGAPFNVTMISHGTIEISGSGNHLGPAVHGVLAWTDQPHGSANPAIKISGGNNNILEVSILFASRSGIDVSASDQDTMCIQAVGQGRVKFQGSGSQFGPYAGCLQAAEPTPTATPETPTSTPTETSTPDPTGTPTPNPTGTPTPDPTGTPTPDPTGTPTPEPTGTPTPEPTGTPTPDPTETPTPDPTETPTPDPTKTPTPEPTRTPTPDPTGTPTPDPTGTPTPEPTQTPDPTPTSPPDPTATTTPQATPSATPSTTPTATPTGSVPLVPPTDPSSTPGPDVPAPATPGANPPGGDVPADPSSSATPPTEDVASGGTPAPPQAGTGTVAGGSGGPSLGLLLVVAGLVATSAGGVAFATSRRR